MMCMYACMHACVYVCIYVCMCVCVCMRMNLIILAYISICICSYICVFFIWEHTCKEGEILSPKGDQNYVALIVFICVHTHVDTCRFLSICTHGHTCPSMNTCMCVCIHTDVGVTYMRIHVRMCVYLLTTSV